MRNFKNCDLPQSKVDTWHGVELLNVNLLLQDTSLLFLLLSQLSIDSLLLLLFELQLSLLLFGQTLAAISSLRHPRSL